MYATETRTGGVGWMPTRPSTLEEVLSVIGGRTVEDSRCRNACQWALIVFDYPDIIADMPVDAKRQFLELVENAKGTRYAALRNYFVDAVDAILTEDEQ